MAIQPRRRVSGRLVKNGSSALMMFISRSYFKITLLICADLPKHIPLRPCMMSKLDVQKKLPRKGLSNTMYIISIIMRPCKHRITNWITEWAVTTSKAVTPVN